jgi:hypothetical protein
MQAMQQSKSIFVGILDRSCYFSIDFINKQVFYSPIIYYKTFSSFRISKKVEKFADLW